MHTKPSASVRHGCDCRKPRIGLASQARERFPEIDFSRSVLVGDSESDIEMGRSAGMRTVRIGGPAAGDASMACGSLLEFALRFESSSIEDTAQ